VPHFYFVFQLLTPALVFAQFLLSLVERKPDIYLDELQTQLQLQHGLVVGMSTIWDALVAMGLTRKKVSYISILPCVLISPLAIQGSC